MEFTVAATVEAPFVETVERVRELLADAGFGVLTEIDLQDTLRTKLGVETEPRVILGACRPELAHRALEVDPRLAAVLPCNVVVSAVGDGGTRVEVFDPAVMTVLSRHPGLAAVAMEARVRLTAMMDALTHGLEDAHEARA